MCEHRGAEEFYSLGAVGSLELELLALEADIVEAPGLDGQGGPVTHLTLLYEESEVDSSAG